MPFPNVHFVSPNLSQKSPKSLNMLSPHVVPTVSDGPSRLDLYTGFGQHFSTCFSSDSLLLVGGIPFGTWFFFGRGGPGVDLHPGLD